MPRIVTLLVILVVSCWPSHAQPPPAVDLGKWIHPLAVFTCSKNFARGISTGDLYARAISWDVPIRVGFFTKFHPDEKSGKGGGWNTADGQGFRQGLLACATAYRHYWSKHEFWVQDYGRAVIGDNGPGWSGKYRWDIAAFSGPEVDKLDAGPGHLDLRYVVVACPRPATCDCDFARAWRRHR